MATREARFEKLDARSGLGETGITEISESYEFFSLLFSGMAVGYKPKVRMSVINDLTGDQRVHRIASTLENNGYSVKVIGRILPHSIALTSCPYETHRMKLWFQRGKLFYLEYNLRLFFYLLFQPVDILHANDLDTLLANFLLSRLRRKRLVYDSHEFFTGVPELLDRPMTRSIWEKLEAWIFPKLSYGFTVNQSIADLYRDKYGIALGVVRNLPISSPVEEVEYSATTRSNILIYQGALNMGRGLELMIQAMNYLPNHRLWIVGRGDIEEQLRKLAASQRHSDRIEFKGFVAFENLSKLTRKAALGFSLEEDLGENYRYASPNKVYDYIQAGVPVIVSDLPEMGRIIRQHKVGQILKTVRRTPRGLASQVLGLLNDPNLYQAYKLACYQAAELLNWEQEQTRLLEIYDKAFPLE
ncbi:MAG: glycosyltransferase family 4 protein [Bacteroidota bacterium]